MNYSFTKNGNFGWEKIRERKRRTCFSAVASLSSIGRNNGGSTSFFFSAGSEFGTKLFGEEETEFRVFMSFVFLICEILLLKKKYN